MKRSRRRACALLALCDQLEALAADHDRDNHQGERCEGERAALVGFVAHGLGVRGEAWDYAEIRRREFDGEHG